jgi:hypothetical protein
LKYHQPAILLKDIRGPHVPYTIAWLFPKADLVNNPSDRLRRFQISRYLNNLPNLFISDNFYQYQEVDKERILYYDYVVFFSVSDYDRDLCKFLKERARAIIFDHCENIFGLGAEDQIMDYASAITCCSKTLTEYTESYFHQKGQDKPIFTIRDPIDDDVLKYPVLPETNRDIALIMGMGANVQYVLPMLEQACKEADYMIHIISEAQY